MKKLTLLALVMTGLCMTYCQPKTEMKPPVVDNGAAMKARFTALNGCFNTGNLAAIDTILDANAVDHSQDTSMHLPNGPEGLKKLLTMYRQGSPDLKSDVKMMTAEGDIVMVYGTMSGTNTGPMMGMPATNKKWSMDFADVVKFGPDLKITEHWGVYDGMKMMMDLGMIPSGPPPVDKKAKK